MFEALRRLPRAALAALLLALALLCLAVPQGALADAAPPWGFATNQSSREMDRTLSAHKARLVDIAAEDIALSRFSFVYVADGKASWSVVGVDADEIDRELLAHDARLISLRAYARDDRVRFAAVMIANAGAERVQSWWFPDVAAQDLVGLAQDKQARIVAIQSYALGGRTHYALILQAAAAEQRARSRPLLDVDADAVWAALSPGAARIVALNPSANGRFDAIIEACERPCPSADWLRGDDARATYLKARALGVRIIAAAPYGACGSGPCYAAVTDGEAPKDRIACDQNGCISEARLAAALCDSLTGKVVGFACRVGGQAPTFGGVARTERDPPRLAFGPDLPIDVASLTKTVTAIATLQLLADNHLDENAKIAPFLYPEWPRGPNVDRLTFRHLLTHASGFSQANAEACGSGDSYAALKAIVARGVAADAIGRPAYGNCNFALLRELLPALRHERLAQWPDGPKRAQKSAAAFLDGLNARVFAPSGVAPRGCRPAAAPGAALSYPIGSGASPGETWGDWSLVCGAGGLQLSADDIHAVLQALARGETLLGADIRRRMLAECLGWDCAVGADCLSPNVCKNGSLTKDGGAALWAYGGIVKCDTPVTLIVNSELPPKYQKDRNVFALVRDALMKAAVSGKPSPCP